LNKERDNREPKSNAKEFVTKHWPWLVAAGMSAAGAAIWLTVRYIQSRRKKDTDGILEGIVDDSSTAVDQASAIVVGGHELGIVLGEEAVEAAHDLSGVVPEGAIADALGAVESAASQVHRKSTNQ
jgi:hypothetical protein